MRQLKKGDPELASPNPTRRLLPGISVTSSAALRRSGGTCPPRPWQAHAMQRRMQRRMRSLRSAKTQLDYERDYSEAPPWL